MAHLQDLAIDLINDVKNTKDAQSRLYLLEQVREIVIHRDKSVLAVVVKDLFDMTIDKSVQIRKFLIKFGDEVMKENAQLVFSHLLTLLNFCMFDSNENVSVMCVSLYHKYYDTLVLLIAGMEKTTDTDPKNLWSIIITLTAKVLEFLSSNRSDKLKAKSLEFCETMILFGLPTPPISSDPRLARSGRKEVLSTGKNAELIPLHHPLISRTVIEQQAEDAYSKMLLWTSKSGPQGYPFSPSLLSLLGQKIALIASQRPKHANNAAKAVTFMIQGKGNHSDKMSGSDRENLARAITRFLRTAMVLSSDSSGLMTTVQAALSYLEGLGLSGPDDTISIGKKRERDDSVPESSNQTLEEDDNEGDSRRKSAIAAVDAAEQALKRKKASMLDNRQAETGSLFHTIGDSVSSGGIARSEYTELAGEIATLPEVFNISAKLTELQPEDGQGGKNHSLEIEKSIPQEPSMYSDLSLISLKRLFDNYYEMKSLNKQVSHFPLSVS